MHLHILLYSLLLLYLFPVIVSQTLSQSPRKSATLTCIIVPTSQCQSGFAYKMIGIGLNMNACVRVGGVCSLSATPLTIQVQPCQSDYVDDNCLTKLCYYTQKHCNPFSTTCPSQLSLKIRCGDCGSYSYLNCLANKCVVMSAVSYSVAQGICAPNQCKNSVDTTITSRSCSGWDLIGQSCPCCYFTPVNVPVCTSFNYVLSSSDFVTWGRTDSISNNTSNSTTITTYTNIDGTIASTAKPIRVYCMQVATTICGSGFRYRITGEGLDTFVCVQPGQHCVGTDDRNVQLTPCVRDFRDKECSTKVCYYMDAGNNYCIGQTFGPCIPTITHQFSCQNCQTPQNSNCPKCHKSTFTPNTETCIGSTCSNVATTAITLQLCPNAKDHFGSYCSCCIMPMARNVLACTDGSRVLSQGQVGNWVKGNLVVKGEIGLLGVCVGVVLVFFMIY